MEIDGRVIGDGLPVYIIAEAGINHNGDIGTALKMVEVAAECGAEAIKFQMRTPRICVPKDQWELERDTPWGKMSYIKYKERMEFNDHEWRLIADRADEVGISWFASAWDIPSVRRLEKVGGAAHKVSSACITDYGLLSVMAESSLPLLVSTGMSDMGMVLRADHLIGIHRRRRGDAQWMFMHTVSSYPTPREELNLRKIEAIRTLWGKAGYSGHEQGYLPTLNAVAMGACVVERHFTLDSSMWGTDQSASLDPAHFAAMVNGVRETEQSLGWGEFSIQPSEVPIIDKLRLHK